MPEAESLSSEEIRNMRRFMSDSRNEKILLKIHDELRAVEDTMRLYCVNFFHQSTWTPAFERAKTAAIDRLGELLDNQGVIGEVRNQKVEDLTARLDNVKQDIEQRHGILKKQAMASFKSDALNNVFILRVKEKVAKAVEQYLTGELLKDEEVRDHVAKVLKQAGKRRNGLIGGAATILGVKAGLVGLGISLGVKAAVGTVIVASMGTGVGIFVVVGGALFLYAFWPEFKNLAKKAKEKICGQKGEVEIDMAAIEDMLAEHPVGDNLNVIN